MRCIARTKNTKKCKKQAYHDSLCLQHYNICYNDPTYDETENTIITDNININESDNKIEKTSTNNENGKKNDNCAICLETNGYKYINKICCNYDFHYKCLETFLCMQMTELQCPICKVTYDKDNIDNIFTTYQIQILYNRMYQYIYLKSRKINKLNKNFSYILQQINNCENNIFIKTNQIDGKEKYKNIIENCENSIVIYIQQLINTYSDTCKNLREIEIYLKKINTIKKNYIRTVEIYNRNKYYSNRMFTILRNRGLM